ncbi:hypothetical protein BH10ACT10_BH10ACT10_01740 [soil metagenome]
MSQRLVTFLTMCLVVGQHFQFATVAGYPATIGLVAGLVLWISVQRGLPTARGVLLSITPLLVALLAAFFTNDLFSSFEFIKTASLLTLAVVVLSTTTSRTDLEKITGPGLRQGLFLSLILVSTLSVAQAVTGARGYTLFFNPFGAHQYLHEYDPLLAYTSIPRAHGFYLEPSYDAFVLCTVALILIGLNYRPRLVALLFVGGLLATQSATGLLLTGILAMILLLRAKLTSGLFIVAGLGLATWFVGDYLRARLASASDIGSSTNYRLVAPLRLMSDTLTNAPLGHPLGSIQTIVGEYHLLLGSERGTSLDNGVYVIVYYFSWMGVLALATCAVLAAVSAYRHRDWRTIAWVTPIWLLGSLLFSGAVVAPEFVLMAWLTICSYHRVAEEHRLVDREVVRVGSA